MKLRTLRHHLGNLGRAVLAVGIATTLAGLWLPSPTLIATGCVLLFGGAYAVIYDHVGSF